MNFKTALAALALIGATTAAAPAAALLNGNLVGVDHIYNNGMTVTTDGTYYNTPGVDGPLNLYPTNGVYDTRISFTDTSISITSPFADQGPGYGLFYTLPLAPGAFNGFHFSDALGAIPTIGSLTVSALSNVVGFDASRIMFDGDDIYIDLKGLGFVQGSIVAVDIAGPAVGGVPEPATWGLMLAGFGLVGTVVRRRAVAVAA